MRTTLACGTLLFPPLTSQPLLQTYGYSHQVTSPCAHVGTRQCTVGGSRPLRCHAQWATCCLATRGRSRAPRWLDAQLVRVEVLRLEVAEQPRPPLPHQRPGVQLTPLDRRARHAHVGQAMEAVAGHLTRGDHPHAPAQRLHHEAARLVRRARPKLAPAPPRDLRGGVGEAGVDVRTRLTILAKDQPPRLVEGVEAVEDRSCARRRVLPIEPPGVCLVL